MYFLEKFIYKINMNITVNNISGSKFEKYK